MNNINNQSYATSEEMMQDCIEEDLKENEKSIL